MNEYYAKVKRKLSKTVNKIYKVKHTGLENEPVGTPYIVCCNHTSALDVAVISVALQSQIHYMAKKEVFKTPILASFAKKMGAIPVDRKSADVGAIKKAISILKSGECMGVFPQGTRQKKKDPKATPIKDGIGMLASHAGVGILPVCIRTKNNRLKMHKKTEFIVGEFIPPEDIQFEELTGKKKYQKIAEYAFSKVCELNDRESEYVDGAKKEEENK